MNEEGLTVQAVWTIENHGENSKNHVILVKKMQKNTTETWHPKTTFHCICNTQNFAKQ
jgi:hypothetical protein